MIGVDNGVSGGVTVLDAAGEVEACYRMPTMKNDSPVRKPVNVIDVLALTRIISHHGGHQCAVETFYGAKSAAAVRSMADSLARIESAVRFAGMIPMLIAPREWQKGFWTGKKRSADVTTKELALAAAGEIWPDVSFIPERCKTPHEGLIDAALIARWAMSNWQ
jgi:hypothetical protein